MDFSASFAGGPSEDCDIMLKHSLCFFLLTISSLACGSLAQAAPLETDTLESFKKQFTNRADVERKSKLLATINKSTSLGDLSQIVLLPEWQQVEGNKLIADANHDVRSHVIKVFKTRALDILTKGTDSERIEVAILVGETAFANLTDETSEYLDQIAQRSRYLRTELAGLSPELAKHIKSENETLRKEAILTLGKIETNPELFAKSVAELLSEKPSNTVKVRRAAAESLKIRIGVVGLLLKQIRAARNQDNFDLVKDLLASSRLLFPIGVKSLRDKDDMVKESALAACKQSTSTLVEVDYIIPIREAEMVALERPDIIGLRLKEFRANLQTEEGLFLAYRNNIRELASHATSTELDTNVRIASLDILEDLAFIRKKMILFEDNLNRLENLATGNNKAPAKLVTFDILPTGGDFNAVIDDFISLTSEKNNKIRLNATETLEIYFSMPDVVDRIFKIKEGEAFKKLAALASTDQYLLVQYTAIRAIGRTAPLNSEIAVPALTKALAHEDLEVRIEAAKALKKYGSKALSALPVLEIVTAEGDPESRIIMMQAIASIGTEAAPILGAVAKNLESLDSHVRIKAAETLGRFGKLSTSQIPALQARLQDQDPNVRNAISAAILKIRFGS